MKYIANIIVKTVLFPVVVAMLIPAYIVFILSPDLHKFKFKMEQ